MYDTPDLNAHQIQQQLKKKKKKDQLLIAQRTRYLPDIFEWMWILTTNDKYLNDGCHTNTVATEKVGGLTI